MHGRVERDEVDEVLVGERVGQRARLTDQCIIVRLAPMCTAYLEAGRRVA